MASSDNRCTQNSMRGQIDSFVEGNKCVSAFPSGSNGSSRAQNVCPSIRAHVPENTDNDSLKVLIKLRIALTTALE